MEISHIIEYSRATKEQLRAAGAVQPECKQMTQPSVLAALHETGKACMEFTDAVILYGGKAGLEAAGTQDTTSQVENCFSPIT